MKKVIIFNFLLLVANIAHAQESATVEVAPFWEDKTFLILIGGAVFLIVLLIIKKVLEKRGGDDYEESDSTENYEDSNL